MSVEQFVKQRVVDTRELISYSEKRKALTAIDRLPYFVSCLSCYHFENGYCEKEENIVPLEVRPYGCGSGEEDIPF